MAKTKKQKFEDIYSGIDEENGMGILYTTSGAYSVVLEMQNPIEEFCGDETIFHEVNNMWCTIIKMLGEEYLMQKQDIFIKSKYVHPLEENASFLQKCYAKHFEGREYMKLKTYLIITREVKKGAFFTFDKNKWKDFLQKAAKVHDLLKTQRIKNRILNEAEVKNYVYRYYALRFDKNKFSFVNYKAGNENIGIGNQVFKGISLIDTEKVDLPSTINPFIKKNIGGNPFPVDLTSFLYDVPDSSFIIYNQTIIIPNQRSEWGKMIKSKNRFASLRDPANEQAVRDISEAQLKISTDGKYLVYMNFLILIGTDNTTQLERAENFIENSLNHSFIIPCKNSYNQLELFRASFPGNSHKLNAKYDRFLSLHDAASCFIYNERPLESEVTPSRTYYTDRRGIPVSMDFTGRETFPKKTDNSNFACLGPSGSGKSFNMNSVVRQLLEQDTDTVMVDTGNSYEGLCSFFGGTYITYTKENPITMNPFKIEHAEYNLEKIEFLKNLIILLWKDKNTYASNEENRYLTILIKEYYANFFSYQTEEEFERQMQKRRIDMIKAWENEEEHEDDCITKRDLDYKIDHIIGEERHLFQEQKRSSTRVKNLSFNSFYEFSKVRLPELIDKNKVSFDYDKFIFLLQAFYKGGEYEATLNAEMDSSLFAEKFIVFEVDEIKEHKILFPIVTLIIMDVFLQKMRLKKNRKALIIEEAWKAIASPVMAEYIKYLYKTVRKHRGIVGVVTQELKDIIGNEVVKDAIISNSDITILLDQNKFKDNYNEIADLLSLNDIEKNKIFSINQLDNRANRDEFKEIYIRRGKEGRVYGVEESREGYMAYTTERIEKEALKIFIRKYGNVEDAIIHYCREWRNSGIRNPMEFAQNIFNKYMNNSSL